MDNKIENAFLISTTRVRIVFSDMQWEGHISQLGISQTAFKMNTFSVTENGDGIKLLRKRWPEWAVFDADSLRCRVDPIYAQKIKEKLDSLGECFNVF